MVQMACTNLFEYGRRQRWSWSIMPNPGNKAKFSISVIRELGISMPDGIPVTPLGGQRQANDALDLPGWGLLAGDTKWDNCGGFNSSLLFLIKHVLNLAGAETAAISGDYLTCRLPDGTIDPVFQSTVRTFGRHYDQIFMYYFTGHEFVKYDNHYFDATANKVFHQAGRYTLVGQHSDGKYCDLRKVTDPVVKARFQNAELFEVINEDIVTNGEIGMPNITQKYLVRVIANKYNHWSGYLLTAQQGMTQRMLDKFNMVGPAQMREEPNALPYGRNVHFNPGIFSDVSRHVR